MSNPKFGTAVTAKPFSVAVVELMCPPLAFQVAVIVNGSLPGLARPLHVLGWLPAYEMLIFTPVGVTPDSVEPVQVPFSLPVMFDGTVFWLVSGGLILTLPVMEQLALPFAVIVGLAALAISGAATAAPTTSPADRAANRILRNMFPPRVFVFGPPGRVARRSVRPPIGGQPQRRDNGAWQP